MQKNTKKTLCRLLLTGLGCCLIIGGAYLLFRALGWTNISREGLQEFIESKGVVAPLVFILISFLQVTFFPIPGAVTIIAGCYVFGSWESFLYSYIGMLLGAIVAFWLGRVIGRRFVCWLVGSQEKTDEWLLKFKNRENVLLFFMFLLPGFPDDTLCSVAGIMPISWGSFITMTVITRATSIGTTVLLLSGRIIPYRGWGLAVLGIGALLGMIAFILCFRRAAELNNFCSRLLHRVSAMKVFRFFERINRHASRKAAETNETCEAVEKDERDTEGTESESRKES